MDRYREMVENGKNMTDLDRYKQAVDLAIEEIQAEIDLCVKDTGYKSGLEKAMALLNVCISEV